MDTLNDSKYANMKELRFRADGGIWRVAFAFDPQRNAVLLVAGDKSGVSGKKFCKRLRDIVLRCMKATSAHLDDWEKHSRLGLEADDLQQVIARWPNIDDRDENGNDFLAINNCMNEVCNGFQIASVEWSSWFDTPMSEIESTYRKWLLLKGTSGGIR